MELKSGTITIRTLTFIQKIIEHIIEVANKHDFDISKWSQLRVSVKNNEMIIKINLSK